MNKKCLMLLIIALVFGSYFRLKDIREELIFNYDTARDMLVVKNIVVNQKLTLLGPTTGIDGVFVGPFYYYLLIIPYILSGGDPVSGAVMEAIIGIATIFLGFIFVKKLFNTNLAVIAAFLISFSPLLISYSRFPLNTNPFPFVILLFYISLYNLGKGKINFFPIVTFLVGFSFSFEAATAIFLLPIALLFILLNKVKIKSKLLLAGGFSFILSVLPQILFELRHNFLMTNSLIKFLFSNGNYQSSSAVNISERVNWFLDNIKTTLIVREEIIRWQGNIIEVVIILSLLLLIYKSFASKNKSSYQLLSLWIFVTIAGLLLYKNSIWGWYIIPLYPAFAILPIVLFGTIMKNALGKILTILIVGLILLANLQMWIKPQKQNDKTRWVLMRDQIKAIDYVYQDSNGQPFDVDVYVPYVIDYPYQYLWVWYGQNKYHRLPMKEKTLYLIAEPNKTQPDLRDAWFLRHKSEGKMIKSVEIDPGITIQKYLRE